MADQHSEHALTPDMITKGVDVPYQTQEDLQYHLENQQTPEDAHRAMFDRIAGGAGSKGGVNPAQVSNFQQRRGIAPDHRAGQ